MVTKQPHPTLTTPRLRLRQFRAEDTDALHACLGDGEAMRFWDRPAHTSRGETERRVRRFIAGTPSGYCVWAVADAATDRCLGMVNYHDANMRSRRADIGYIVDPAHHRQGIATEAVTALLALCLGGLRLHRIQALVHPANAASCALVEKLGFRREGLLREHLRVGKAWHDTILYALLRTDRARGDLSDPASSPADTRASVSASARSPARRAPSP